MSLTTHEGYYADFKGRMDQAKKHSQDQVEMSYNLVNMFNSPAKFLRKFHVFYSCCEVYLMPLVIPIFLLTSILQDVFEVLPRSTLDADGKTFYIFNNVNTVILLIVLGLFEILKTRASRQLYQIETMSIFYALQNPILQIPVVLVFGFGPMVWASYSLLTDRIIFNVTQKKSLTTKTSDTLSPGSESIFASE